jgi:hypothetical protein
LYGIPPVHPKVLIFRILLFAGGSGAGGGRAGLEEPAPQHGGGRRRYGDAKVANRDTKVWHGATEKGP